MSEERTTLPRTGSQASGEWIIGLGRLWRRFTRAAMPWVAPAPYHVLVDVRETDTSRGFHAMAVLNLISNRLAGVKLYALTTGSGDELSALEVFSFDHGIPVALHNEAELGDLRVDIVFAVAEDGTTLAANSWITQIATRSLVGVIFPPAVASRGMVIVDGHDTPTMARQLCRLLHPGMTDLTLANRPQSCEF